MSGHVHGKALKDSKAFNQLPPQPPAPLKEPAEPTKWVPVQIPDLQVMTLPELEKPRLTILEKLIPHLKKPS